MTITDPNGLVWINGGPHTDDHLAFTDHEAYLVQIARALLPEGGLFLDVGAHVGLYTLNLASKAGEIWSIEANPDTYDVLVKNVEANRERFPACAITLMNLAAWDQREDLNLIDVNDKSTGGSTRCVPAGEDRHTTVGFPMDEVLSVEPRIDLVKIDVEGAEARVLKGMRYRIMKDRPVLLIEMHDVYFGEQIRLDTLSFLDAFGYHWNEDLTFGGSYYLLAQPDEPDEDVVEIVRAGQ